MQGLVVLAQLAPLSRVGLTTVLWPSSRTFELLCKQLCMSVKGTEAAQEVLYQAPCMRVRPQAAHGFRSSRQACMRVSPQAAHGFRSRHCRYLVIKAVCHRSGGVHGSLPMQSRHTGLELVHSAQAPWPTLRCSGTGRGAPCQQKLQHPRTHAEVHTYIRPIADLGLQGNVEMRCTGAHSIMAKSMQPYGGHY